MSNENFSKKEVIKNIYPLIENTCMRYNLIPLEVDFSKESGRWFLRIFIYSNDHDVNHMDCENISCSLSDFLDELIPVKYYLEVSSPGLERRFKSEKEYIIFSRILMFLGILFCLHLYNYITHPPAKILQKHIKII